MYDNSDFVYEVTPKADSLVKMYKVEINENIELEIERQLRIRFEEGTLAKGYLSGYGLIDQSAIDLVVHCTIDSIEKGSLGTMLLREEINEWEFDDVLDRIQ